MNNLFKEKLDEYMDNECDGCGGDIKIGEVFIGGITSCCGSGCYRRLCKKCAEWIALQLKTWEEIK